MKHTEQLQPRPQTGGRTNTLSVTNKEEKPGGKKCCGGGGSTDESNSDKK